MILTRLACDPVAVGGDESQVLGQPVVEIAGDPTPLLPIFFALELLLTFAVLAVALRWSTPTLGAAALAASGAILVPLLLSRWTTQPYYVYVGAIVACGIGLLNARVRSV